MGIGIDEDTAIVVERESRFYVLGAGAVYVVDGTEITRTNMAEADAEQMLSVFDVRLHVLTQGDRFSFSSRRPEYGRAKEVEPEESAR